MHHDIVKSVSGNRFTVFNGRWEDIAHLVMCDHTITDPPYSEQVHKGAMFKGGKTQGIDQFDHLEDISFLTDVLSVTKRWTLCFTPLEWFGEYQKMAGDCYIRSGIWRKPNGMPQMSGDRPSAGGCEGIAIMHRSLAGGRKGRTIWNGGGKHAVWRHNVCRGPDRFHPTQKPLGLLVQLIQDFTEPGDIIFDPFGGSFTTGVACVMYGRNFVGCEIKEEYFDKGAARLLAAEQSLSLEAMEAGQNPLFTNEELGE